MVSGTLSVTLLVIKFGEGKHDSRFVGLILKDECGFTLDRISFSTYTCARTLLIILFFVLSFLMKF